MDINLYTRALPNATPCLPSALYSIIYCIMTLLKCYSLNQKKLIKLYCWSFLVTSTSKYLKHIHKVIYKNDFKRWSYSLRPCITVKMRQMKRHDNMNEHVDYNLNKNSKASELQQFGIEEKFSQLADGKFLSL